MEEEGRHRLQYHWPYTSTRRVYQKLGWPRSVNHHGRPKEHLPEDAGAPFSTCSSPDPSAASNRGAQLTRLGPATGGSGAATLVTSGIGVVIWVTLHAHGHVMGQETAFPLDATFL